MFDHTTIWKCIDRLAQEHGYSPSGLAQKAGLDSTTFNKSKRTAKNGKQRWPSTESIAKILSVTATPMSDFLDLGKDERQSTSNTGKESFPVITFSKVMTGEYFSATGTPKEAKWEEILIPFSSDGLEDQAKDCMIYTIHMDTTSYEPAYREDDVLVIATGTHIHENDRVLIKTADQGYLIAQIQDMDRRSIDILDLNRDTQTQTVPRTIPRSEISWIANILWAGQ